MVGRAAGGQQSHHGIDDAALVDQLTDRGKSNCLGDVKRAAHGFTRQLVAQRSARIDEGRARHLQAHRFKQHLVAVGRAIEGAGALAMVGAGLGCQQGRTSHQTLRCLLAHVGLVGVGQPRSHRTGGHKNSRQMTKLQSSDQEAGNDLVADTQQQCCVKDIMAERNGGGHGNHVAREQAEFHARRALSHAIAHGRHAARHLRRRTELARLGLDDLRVMLQWRVRRQHVVVRCHDGDVGCTLADDAQLVVRRQRSEGVRHVGTSKPLGTRRARRGLGQTLEVGAARGLAALTDTPGNGCNDGVEFHGTQK